MILSQQVIILLSAVTVLVTVPQYTAAHILSCANVDCPIEQGTRIANCNVAGERFSTVGVADLSTDVNVLDDISWTKAVRASALGASNKRTFDQFFYLGSPPGFPGNAGACAVFFSQVSDRVKFDEQKDPLLSQATCQQALTESCVNALVKRASSVNLQTITSTEAACQRLQDEFTNNLDAECAGAATGSKWAGVIAQALSGATAPKPISGSQNASSNCWPTLPKSNDLTLVETVTTTGDFKTETILRNIFTITPILTVLIPGNGGNATAVTQNLQAALACVKAVDLNAATNATLNDGSGPNSEGGFHLSGSGTLAVWVGVMSVLTSLFI